MFIGVVVVTHGGLFCEPVCVLLLFDSTRMKGRHINFSGVVSSQFTEKIFSLGYIFIIWVKRFVLFIVLVRVTVLDWNLKVSLLLALVLLCTTDFVSCTISFHIDEVPLQTLPLT